MHLDGYPIQRVGYRRNSLDVGRAVRQVLMRRVPARAVVMIATARPAARFLQRLHDAAPDTIVATGSYVDSTALADELSLLEAVDGTGLIVTHVVPPVDGSSTLIVSYKSALARFFPGEAPDDVSLEGYLVARLLLEGLRRVGPYLDNERLVEALEGLDDVDIGTGAHLHFGPDAHQASHQVWGTQLDPSAHYQPMQLE